MNSVAGDLKREYYRVKHVLAVMLARIGDLIQSFPAFSDLNRSAGGAGVAVLVQKDLLPIARLYPHLTTAIPFDGDRLIASLRGERGLSKAGVDYLDALFRQIDEVQPDLVVNLTHTAFSGMLCRATHAPDLRGRIYAQGSGTALCGDWTKYFFTLLESRSCNGFNIVDVHRDIAGGLRGELDPPVIPENAREYAKKRLHELSGKHKFAMAIGAHHPLRRWPADRWRDTASIILKSGETAVVLLGSMGEKDIANAITRDVGERCLNLCGDTDPVQLAAVIDECDVMIGHDSGPLHLAAALGKPCLGLYLAMASAWDTAPYLEGAVSIEPDIACHPCSESGDCSDPKCHQSITPELVADVAIEMFKRHIPESSRDCVLRISRFDPQGRLTLGGQCRSNDALRLFWREYFSTVLTSDVSQVSFGGNHTYVYNRLPAIADKVECFKKEIVALALQTSSQLEQLLDENLKADIDPLSAKISVLFSQFAEIRPLLDLYTMDCFSGEVYSPTSRAERVLSAQERLLGRIGMLQHYMSAQSKQLKDISSECSIAAFEKSCAACC